jgi:hypothetical protein
LILRGRFSISERIDAPVVENPLTLSKTASVNEGIYPLVNKGKAPKRLVKIHAGATITNVNFILRLNFLLRKRRINMAAQIQLQSIGTQK